MAVDGGSNRNVVVGRHQVERGFERCLKGGIALQLGDSDLVLAMHPVQGLFAVPVFQPQKRIGNV